MTTVRLLICMVFHDRFGKPYYYIAHIYDSEI